MGIRSFKQIPKDPAEWDKFFRGALVEPSNNSVGADQLKADAVITAKIASGAVSLLKLAAADADGKLLIRRAGLMVYSTLNDTDIPASIARDAEVTTAIDAAIDVHEADANPHPQYLTQTEGDARYRELTDAVTYAEITGKPAVLAMLFTGTGSPESVVTAGVGSLYLRQDGGVGSTLYVKETGTGNTGWSSK